MQILYSDNDIAVCVKPVGPDSEMDVPAALEEALRGTQISRYFMGLDRENFLNLLCE